MAPPKKRPPQGRPGQKRPPQGKRPPQARKPAGAKPAANDASVKGAAAGGAEEQSQVSAGAEETAAAASGAPLSKSAEERKAKRESARQERLAAARKRQQAKRRKQILISIVLLVAIGCRNSFYGSRGARAAKAAFASAAEEAGCGDIELVPGRAGRQAPSGGRRDLRRLQDQPAHLGRPPRPDLPVGLVPRGSGQRDPGPQPRARRHHHPLQGSARTKRSTRSMPLPTHSSTVSSPSRTPEIEKPIALASWRHMQQCDELNTKAIEGFISDRCNKGPEKLGITCNQE